MCFTDCWLSCVIDVILSVLKSTISMEVALTLDFTAWWKKFLSQNSSSLMGSEDNYIPAPKSCYTDKDCMRTQVKWWVP